MRTSDGFKIYDFYFSLIENSTFQKTVNDIVIEFGNSLYQEKLDDFILNGNDKYNNGLAFLRWIRQVDMAPACFTPVLMSTGHASRRIVLEFNKFGASSIVVKPLSPIILKKRLENILIDTRAYIVEAGRVVIDGAVKYTQPKKQDKLVYDPGFLSRLVRNDVRHIDLKNPSNSIKLQNDDDIFELELKTQSMFD